MNIAGAAGEPVVGGDTGSNLEEVDSRTGRTVSRVKFMSSGAGRPMGDSDSAFGRVGVARKIRTLRRESLLARELGFSAGVICEGF